MDANVRRRDSGFTLLEVLVAAMIAAMALGVLFRVGLEGVDQATAAERSQMAVAIAQSRIALVTATPLIGDGRGQDGIFRWHSHVAAIATASPSPDSATAIRQAGDGQPTLLSINVNVVWRQGFRTDHVLLETKRLVFLPVSGSVQ